MKRLAIATLLCALAISATALAWVNPEYEDNIGVYFDPEGSEVCLARVDEIGTYHMYVVASELTSGAVKGFELGLTFDGPLMATNYTFPEGSGALNLQQVPTFLVGFAVPLWAVDRAVVVMEFDILVYSLDPLLWDQYQDAHVYIKEIFFHSLEDPVPAYLDENGEIKALHQSTGTELDPVTIFSMDPSGCGGVVASDETTWDSLKSLYR